jgi:DNA-binding transcriptional LysR family regulator
MQINASKMQPRIAQLQNTKMDDWNDYLYFFKVSECGSLKGAAHVLGVNHSTVFRRINTLEDKLNVRLFERLKSGYILTSAGQEILECVQQMDEQMDAIHRRIQGKDIRLSGYLKISTTDTLGYYWLPHYIKRFKKRYPDIIIDLDIKTRYTNLTKREADIVIPAVNKQPDHMVGRKLSPLYFKMYASAQYLEINGLPKDSGDFVNHRFLLPNEARAGLPANQWLRKLVPENCIEACCDKLSGLYKLAKQDLGITILPHYLGDADSSLVEIMKLPEHCHHAVWILTHPDLRHTARVKAFMQFMYQETAGIEK